MSGPDESSRAELLQQAKGKIFYMKDLLHSAWWYLGIVRGILRLNFFVLVQTPCVIRPLGGTHM